MDVVFGWDLDAQHFPDTANGKLAQFNSLITGPGSLLSLLETKLGLRRPAVPRALRVADYLALLRKADDGKNFYSASLKADAWSTSDYLLTVRDELIAAGWSKDAIDLEKVDALSIVETLGVIPDGFGERLQLVNAALTKYSKVIIETLRVVGSVATLPATWKTTIGLLVAGGTALEEIEYNATTCDTDLQKLQVRLTSLHSANKVSFTGDGSLCVIDAHDELQAAQFVSVWLTSHADRSDVVLVRGNDCSSLNRSFERHMLPNIGCSGRSRFRAILQVLPLAFEAVCRPLDPKKLVELLLVKGGPFPSWMAKPLIHALHQAPGIGSAAWVQAWQECTAQQAERIQKEQPELSKAAATELALAKIANWQAWFAECQSEQPNNQIALADADAICARVQQWAQQKRVTDRFLQNMYTVAAGQAQMLRKVIARDGSEIVSLTQMRKMIHAVADYGSSVSNTEAAEWALVDRPGQIWGPAQSVVWWGFAQPHSATPRGAVWSESDYTLMRNNGIAIERPVEKLRRESFAWRMAILNAKERVILVKPRIIAGERAIAHPLWDEMASVVDTNSWKQVTCGASEVFSSPSVDFGNARIECVEKQPIALPGPLRTWTVPPNLIRPRFRESYASINKLLGCSLAWSLQYGGQMWQPEALNLPEKQLLLGMLAHAVVKNLYEAKQQWDPYEAQAHAAAVVTELIPQMAASLQLPGLSPQLREATEAIPASVFHLVTLLEGAGATVEGCEVPLKGALTKSTELSGKVDMLIKLPSGERAVLDFKWSSSPYWYRKQLADGKALQLAIYSWLAGQHGGTKSSAPDESAGERPLAPSDNQQLNGRTLRSGGYFMFRHGELFFTRDGIFPQYTFVRKMVRTLDDTFKATLEAYERALTKVASGTIIAKGINDDSVDVFDPESTLADPPCTFCAFGYFCGRRELQ